MAILISVIVPAYNEEKLITSCLKSLENQDFGSQNYEVIVVNNASKDRTNQIVKDFNLKLFNEPKKGASLAVKKGFLKASGQIVATTDADTIVNTSWLSNIYEAFKSNPDAVIVGGKLILAPKNFLTCFAGFIINYIGGVILKNT
jgi:glycosyltransferase involved in cell wall biosynthesis